MVLNIHLLTHICPGVLKFGLVWGHNSFLYEAENRYLLELCHSPNNVAFQICHKFRIFKLLPLLCEVMVSSSEALNFCQRVLKYKHLVNCTRSNDDKCILHGSPKCKTLTYTDKLEIAHCVDVDNLGTCFLYQRITFQKKRFTTEDYCPGGQKKRLDTNDSYAFLTSGQSVLIKQIVNIPGIHRVILLVQRIKLSKRPIVRCDNFNFNSIHKIESKNDIFYVRADFLDRPAFYIQGFNGTSYLADIPYGCTVE